VAVCACALWQTASANKNPRILNLFILKALSRSDRGFTRQRENIDKLAAKVTFPQQ